MMKVKAKAPWIDAQGIHKKGELVEIETASFNPLLMAEVAEEKVEKVSATAKTAKKTTKTKKG